jgi:universal stress protein A
MLFRKILCPVDFSPCARQALQTAAQLAKESAAPLILAHVWQPTQWAAAEVQLAPGVIQDMLDAEHAELARWRQLATELRGGEVEVRFLTGAPWDQIVAAAHADRAVDLIVMGTHGRTGLKHVLLGSVAEKVVRHAPCAVLVVRKPEP